MGIHKIDSPEPQQSSQPCVSPDAERGKMPRSLGEV